MTHCYCRSWTYNELFTIADNSIDLSNKGKYEDVVGIMGIFQLARDLKLPGRHYLEATLNMLGIPCESLHKAVTDANFILKLLSMLFLRNLEGEDLTELQQQKPDWEPLHGLQLSSLVLSFWRKLKRKEKIDNNTECKKQKLQSRLNKFRLEKQQGRKMLKLHV